ncbi:unnamed protein product [Bursaphelenchus okinawaensis]|uniref:Succinate--CoA ligase [ADP-forming] subunit beta, mitochondrial n=1 Tax=Bursaphelenchus okinawaensis TaxID=465554 RepID=A0A811KUP8_9BILA|nr:unnamed protein product [Bursaphelenchus okinawaensis]CAG9111516.1 unnamed protein product [Bursaphelenchus okinawaensis]
MLRNSISCLARTRVVGKRFLNLQEFQSKEILEKNGCTVQKFFVVSNSAEAEQKFQQYEYSEYAVKAQVLAGGRGKGRFIGGPKDLGGVYITKDKSGAIKACSEMIGKKLVTAQTTKEGTLVKKVMVADSVPICRETYLALLLDRESNAPVVVASAAGGMDIEEVAKKHPEKIIKVPINVTKGIQREESLKVAEALEFKGELKEKTADEIERLYNLMLKIDATQIEINPLAETSDNRVFCIDAKLNFDDNAEFRQKQIFESATEEEETQDPREVRAKAANLNFIALDGDIACLVNGAGLAMATMDMIKLSGGEPANFLDVGGAVTEKQVYEAFQILTSGEGTRAILVNIFGGIVNCQTIAAGVIAAVKKAGLQVPLVVRLEGTNATEAHKMLKDSKLPIQIAQNLDTAARMAVEAANEGSLEHASA